MKKCRETFLRIFNGLNEKKILQNTPFFAQEGVEKFPNHPTAVNIPVWILLCLKIKNRYSLIVNLKSFGVCS